MKQLLNVKDTVLSLSRSSYPSSSIDPRTSSRYLVPDWVECSGARMCSFWVDHLSMNAFRAAYVVIPCIASFILLI